MGKKPKQLVEYGNVSSKEEKDPLREGAEEILAEKTNELENLPSDIRELIHELKVHRIELEMQNEELRKAQLELEQSRDKYADLYDFAPIGYFTVDERGIIQDVNLHGAFLLDMKKERLVKASFSRFLNSESQNKFHSFRKQLQSGKTPRSCELRIFRKDKAELYVQLEGVAQFESDGSFSHFKLAMLDITKRNQTERELVKAQKLESLSVIAKGIAHDFNNLLTVILGNIDLVKLLQDSDQRLDIRLDESKKAALRMKDLTVQLLSFSTDGMPLKTTISVPELILDSVSFVLTGSNVDCEYSISQDLWRIEADEVQLAQPIRNIVINACQAMPEGGTIQVSAENTVVDELERAFSLSGGKYVKVSIRDHGAGIPGKHLSKIFDPYFTTKHTGSGLGLAVSYSIVKNHGGHIEVKSGLGEGATFTIYLPASEKEVVGVKEEAEPLIVEGGGKILVMDDEETIRDLATDMLYDLGFDVVSMRPTAKAVSVYREAMESGKPFNAVVLGLTDPGGSEGKSLIEKFFRIDPRVNTIVSTGYSEADATEYGTYGFSGVLPKPYTIDELNRVLHNVLKGQSGE